MSAAPYVRPEDVAAHRERLVELVTLGIAAEDCSAGGDATRHTVRDCGKDCLCRAEAAAVVAAERGER